jgi:hypothetical protein
MQSVGRGPNKSGQATGGTRNGTSKSQPIVRGNSRGVYQGVKTDQETFLLFMFAITVIANNRKTFRRDECVGHSSRSCIGNISEGKG